VGVEKEADDCCYQREGGRAVIDDDDDDPDNDNPLTEDGEPRYPKGALLVPEV
jgi:hypothetical protein